ncbi:MAG: hypothetical protein R6U63_05470 [Longimicrobiales bacterium]
MRWQVEDRDADAVGRRSTGRGAVGRQWWLPAVLAVATACAGGGGPGVSGPEAWPDVRAEGPDTVAADPAEPDSAAPEAEPAVAADTLAPDTLTPDALTAADTASPTVEDPMPADLPGAAGATPSRAVPLPVPILPGALLPQTRIVAFYGNPASEHMGILGELPPDAMLARLDAEVEAWRRADPSTPVRPALQMIAVMATGDPGRDSLFRLRMPDSRIREVAGWAERRDALLFLDVQPGRSTVPAELAPLERWLARPDVHLALDPEWAMSADAIPGRQIGSLTADDINYAVDFLADIVERYHLPPKVLVVHRFTTSMLQRADEIRRDPRVQVVINMDGWGGPPQKRAAYRDIVAPEADQFTGFKLFFRNDLRNGSVLLTPAELLELEPVPVYIQYQ